MNASPHPIPVPESPFDNVVDMGVKALTFGVENARVLVAKYPYVAIGLASFIGMFIVALLLRGSSKGDKKEKAKAPATTTKDSKKKKAT